MCIVNYIFFNLWKINFLVFPSLNHDVIQYNKFLFFDSRFNETTKIGQLKKKKTVKTIQTNKKQTIKKIRTIKEDTKKNINQKFSDFVNQKSIQKNNTKTIKKVNKNEVKKNRKKTKKTKKNKTIDSIYLASESGGQSSMNQFISFSR